ncbi:MAG: hypothetical protein DLM73_09810 [Chthoniobacterales bacterium]|nr:MAG: hypothetical protein DLM73_09810 [Chthoniobacterales bacterium]
MRSFLILVVALCTATIVVAADLSPKDVITQFYRAHRSKHDPLDKTDSLGRYFAPELLKLYLKDIKEANGEVGRVDSDPLYNAQLTEISDFTISEAERVGTETRVTVRFKNLGKATRIVYALIHTPDGWRITDIRYEDGSSLKKILQSDL